MLDIMTIYGHNMVMSKENGVKIAEFKSHLSQYIRNVRKGHALTLLDRETPVARVLPYPAMQGRLTIRKPRRSAKEVRLPPVLKKGSDSLSVLLEERQSGR